MVIEYRSRVWFVIFIIAMSGDYSMEVTLHGISIEKRLEIIKLRGTGKYTNEDLANKFCLNRLQIFMILANKKIFVLNLFLAGYSNEYVCKEMNYPMKKVKKLHSYWNAKYSKQPECIVTLDDYQKGICELNQATSIIREWNKLTPISNICEIFHYTPDEIEAIVGQTRSVALRYMSDHMGDHVISKLMGLNMRTIQKIRKKQCNCSQWPCMSCYVL